MADNRKKDSSKNKWQPSEPTGMTMASPSIRPRPQPTPRPTPEQIKAQQIAKERSHQLTQQLVAAQFSRQNWINKPNVMRRVQNTMAKDATLRNAVFTVAKGATAFVMLDPKTQLRTVQTVDKNLRTIARTAANRMQGAGLAPNPNDMTNPYNQANPNNFANQQQAIQQGIILNQDNEVSQRILQQDEDSTNLERQEENETENLHTFELTEAEVHDISAHNKENYIESPSPSYSGKQPDDDELKTGGKVLEHAGEEKALQAFMHKDKSAFVEGAKGIADTVGKEVLEHAALSAAKMFLTPK